MTSIADLLAIHPLPRSEQRLLLQAATGFTLTTLIGFPERHVEDAAVQLFHALCTRRLQGEPVAYLTGEREFYGLTFQVDARLLIPRPETEGLVDWALELGPRHGPWRVLELGTGSGALAVTLKHLRPDWHISATDQSEAMLALARHNAENLQAMDIDWFHGHWFDPLQGCAPFDLILSNPPYVEPDSPWLLQGDLRFEPRHALVAARHGMADLEHLIARAPDFVAPGGHLLLEHGHAQGAACRQRLAEAGFEATTTRRDLGGLERLSGGQWHAELALCDKIREHGRADTSPSSR